MIGTLPECDFDDPQAVVTAFIAAMNAWEVAAWKLKRTCRQTGDPGAYQHPVLAEMNRIFGFYCTPKDRKYGRNGSFQKPPEYDPAYERITEVAADDKKKQATVTTERQAVFGAGSYRYTLQRRHGKWLIDNLKYKSGEKWIKHIL